MHANVVVFSKSALRQHGLFRALFAQYNRICFSLYDRGVFKKIRNQKKGLAWQIKQNGLKGIQNDFYEFKIRSKNAREEADILYLMRQINSRMSLLKDAIDEGDMTEQEREKWMDLLFQYGDLRNYVSNLKVSNRNYGLWYDYSQLDDLDREKLERGY